MNQADRRVRRTKKVLQESLAVLFNEKKLENITIRELTDYADVHRSTFYAHYEDIYALYTEIEDSVIEQ
ncbi:TetR/AcrR family transcriptional regulator [Enterococcus sp. S86.2]|nr:TetR family transcriptional regulator [Enterococcus sp. S86.2]